jgi:hypothetical protein
MSAIRFVRFNPIAFLAASCAFVLAQGREDKGPPDPAKGVREVRAGMTPKVVRNLMGRPPRIARQILYRRFLEQWSYDTPNPVWIDFNCVKGQEPIVLAVHRPGGDKPAP